MKNIECVTCGKMFKSNGTRTKYCPACRSIISKERSRAYQRHLILLKNSSQIKPAKPMEELNNVINLAREHGMSYGKYVQLTEPR